jgi:hypothetical protein
MKQSIITRLIVLAIATAIVVASFASTALAGGGYWSG